MDVHPNILIIGPSQAGKTSVGRILADYYHTSCANTGDLIADAMLRDGLTPRKRTEAQREEMFSYAAQRKAEQPDFFARLGLDTTHIVTGTRTAVEFAAARAGFDLAIWVSRPGHNGNTTDRLRTEMADIVIHNDRGLVELEDEVITRIPAFLELPEFYVVGRYRHYLADGSYDLGAMARMAADELRVGRIVRECGLRAFCPANTFHPLDGVWTASRLSRSA